MGTMCKLGYFFSYWLTSMNLFLIVVCFPCIQNPGPMISVVYQNVRGFVPFSGLGETVPPLDVNKLQEFQTFIFDKNPGIVVLLRNMVNEGSF